MPHFNLNPGAKKTAVIGTLLLIVASLGTLSIHGVSLPTLRGSNLFTLIGDLNGTTTKILDGSKALSQQVNQVQTQLSQLNRQENVLNQQIQTGKALGDQLQEQITLTNVDVSLMRDILSREKRTSAVAHQVAVASGQLASGLNQNASILTELVSALDKSNQGSAVLNRDLDALLSELQDSKAEFRFFGQLNQLLNNVLGKSATSGLLSNLNPTQLLGGSNNTGSSAGTPNTGQDTNGPVQTILGGLLGGSK